MWQLKHLSGNRRKLYDSLYCHPYVSTRKEKHFNVGVPLQYFIEYYKEKISLENVLRLHFVVYFHSQ